MKRLEIGSERKISVTEEGFVHLLCISGGGKLIYEDEEYEICRGDSYFLPAGLGDLLLEGNMTVMLSQI